MKTGIAAFVLVVVSIIGSASAWRGCNKDRVLYQRPRSGPVQHHVQCSLRKTTALLVC